MPPSAQIITIAKNLYLISLPVPITGFDGFITSWVYTGGPVVVIDVGPSATAGHLVKALVDIGVTRPDAILLTHIHIDHAGGIGQVAAAFPQTPVVCHPKAIEHVVDPTRLWEGSQKTLGALAQQYGPIAPVASRQVHSVEAIPPPGLEAIPAPGHAPHQYSFLIEDWLFAGESGGVCIGLEEEKYYLRPATPPRLHLETYLESIDRLIDCRPKNICYGHIGMQPNATAMLQTHRDQLLRWRDWIRPWFDKDPQNSKHSTEACLEHLLATDPLLSNFSQLTPEAQERERFFLRNSVRGYWGYLSDTLV
ncbi:MAG: MBL fold metallo-hydrolase [Desulfobacteraceae bacterium]|nr:MBL fold metallo-hydrolase [Desulfobacteraceae bacterium]